MIDNTILVNFNIFGLRSKCTSRIDKEVLTIILRPCIGVCESFSYLVEQWTVCDGNTQGSEAPAQHHVIRSIVAIAATTTGN